VSAAEDASAGPPQPASSTHEAYSGAAVATAAAAAATRRRRTRGWRPGIQATGRAAPLRKSQNVFKRNAKSEEALNVGGVTGPPNRSVALMHPSAPRTPTRSEGAWAPRVLAVEPPPSHLLAPTLAGRPTHRMTPARPPRPPQRRSAHRSLNVTIHNDDRCRCSGVAPRPRPPRPCAPTVAPPHTAV